MKGRSDESRDAGTIARPDFPEMEPNESKGQATTVVGMAAGDTLGGHTTGTSTTVPGAASADRLLVKTAPAARHARYRGDQAVFATVRGAERLKRPDLGYALAHLHDCHGGGCGRGVAGLDGEDHGGA